MRIWLIQPGEELPIDPGIPRLLRTGILAEMLADRGHEVTYWTSTFSHARKMQRFETDVDINVRDNYKIKLLHSPGYHKNVSIKRIYDHTILARKFRTQSLSEPCPDIILCSMPTIDLSLAATEMGTKMNVPVVLDIRDKWPDVFREAFHNWMAPIVGLALFPMYANLRKACRNATSILGITDGFLDWGLKQARREKTEFDRVFHHAYKSEEPSCQEISKAQEFWATFRIEKSNCEFIVCFFGALGPQSEITTVVDAARILSAKHKDIKFVLCGKGEYFEKFVHYAISLDNVIFPGWVCTSEIWTLMRMSDVALAPIRSNLNYVDNIPNKIVEYLSAGLPIVSSLTGNVEELLGQNQCGITYPNSDAEALADIFSDLYQNWEKLENMACKSRKLFEEKFVAENVYCDMINHLKHIALNHQNTEDRTT